MNLIALNLEVSLFKYPRCPGRELTIAGHWARHCGKAARARAYMETLEPSDYVEVIEPCLVGIGNLLLITGEARETGTIGLYEASCLRKRRDDLESILWCIRDGYQEPPWTGPSRVGSPVFRLEARVRDLDLEGSSIVDMLDELVYPSDPHLEAMTALREHKWWL